MCVCFAWMSVWVILVCAFYVQDAPGLHIDVSVLCIWLLFEFSFSFFMYRSCLVWSLLFQGFINCALGLLLLLIDKCFYPVALSCSKDESSHGIKFQHAVFVHNLYVLHITSHDTMYYSGKIITLSYKYCLGKPQTKLSEPEELSFFCIGLKILLNTPIPHASFICCYM